jgi:hypothetical protein
MSDPYESRADLADKIDYEGGIFSALDYGIRTEDMPAGDDELTGAWRSLEASFLCTRILADAVSKLLSAEVATEESAEFGVASEEPGLDTIP